MVNKEASGRKNLVAQALGRDGQAIDVQKDLAFRRRINERIIQVILLFCGILSIFTTLGIVYVLGRESINLFVTPQWEGTNKALIADISPNQTDFQTISGSELSDGQVIRIGDEQMRIIEYSANSITVNSIGSGAGLRSFCAGDIQIANSSRSISDEEIATCAENGIEALSLRVGIDALAIAVNAENDFATDITREELSQIIGSATTWSDVRSSWPNEEIVRFMPGADSGTFDFFVDAIFDGDTTAALTMEPFLSEDDNELVRGVRANPYAISFFGFAYYQQNQDNLNLVSIEGIDPSEATVNDGTYSLSRPLYLVTSAEILANQPQVSALVNYYYTHVNEEILDVGYFPVADDVLVEGQRAYLDAIGIDGDELPEIDVPNLTGNIDIAGSSTVFPLTQRIVTRFIDDGFVSHLTVERGINGTDARRHRARAEVEREERVTLTEFFFHDVWQPAIGEFGVRPLVNATLMTSTIAMLVALPLGLGAAIYLSEYASERVRKILKPILEIIGGIPTVVYGYFALTFMTPLLRSIFGQDVVGFYNTASAGIVVGILIIPLVSSMSDDALHAVPQSLREASHGLGANKLETTIKVVIPAALSGILAAFIVAVSRAIGETMVVAIAAGAGPNFTFNPFDSAETMTGHIARISGGDLSYDSVDYNSIFAIGLTLFVITLVLNVLSRTIISRFRENY